MSAGLLVLVATPIGNLGDLSPRATEVLATADVIACEDTRHTRKLLTYAGIAGKRLLAVHDHNEAKVVRPLLARLEAGETVALVSDAGTPGVADPGYRLVAAAAEAGVRIEAVPGPSAVLAALVVSGFATDRFCFEGFLPRKGTGRRERIEALRTERRTAVLYEAPHRVRDLVADLARSLDPLRRVSVSRELTKKFEATWRGTLGSAIEHLAATEPRGEYVVVLDGAPEPEPASAADVEAALLERLAEGATKRDAATEVARELGLARRDVYELVTRL